MSALADTKRRLQLVLEHVQTAEDYTKQSQLLVEKGLLGETNGVPNHELVTMYVRIVAEHISIAQALIAVVEKTMAKIREGTL